MTLFQPISICLEEVDRQKFAVDYSKHLYETDFCPIYFEVSLLSVKKVDSDVAIAPTYKINIFANKMNVSKISHDVDLRFDLYIYLYIGI